MGSSIAGRLVLGHCSVEVDGVALVMHRDLVEEVARSLASMIVALRLNVVRHCFAELAATVDEVVALKDRRRVVASADIVVDRKELGDDLREGRLSMVSVYMGTAVAVVVFRQQNWNSDAVIVGADFLELMVDIFSHHNLDSLVGELDYRMGDSCVHEAAVGTVLTERIVMENGRSLVAVGRRYVGSSRTGSHSIAVGIG